MNRINASTKPASAPGASETLGADSSQEQDKGGTHFTDSADDSATAEATEEPVGAVLRVAAEERRQLTGPKGRWAAAVVALFAIAALVSIATWQGLRWQESQRVERQRSLLLEVGKQGALNLTTIDYAQADADAARIVDGAAGAFKDDFAKRAPAFVELVKRSHAKSEGTVTGAGIESLSGESARVLVSVSVKTTTSDAAEPQTSLWRMRIDVTKVGDDLKISNVGFVP